MGFEDDKDLADFLRKDQPTRPQAEDIAKLADHVEKNPPKRRWGVYEKAGIGIIVFLIVLRIIVKLILQSP